MLGPIGDALGGAFNGAVDGFFGGSSSGGVKSSGGGGTDFDSIMAQTKALNDEAVVNWSFWFQERARRSTIQSEVVHCSEGNTGLSFSKAKLIS